MFVAARLALLLAAALSVTTVVDAAARAAPGCADRLAGASARFTIDIPAPDGRIVPVMVFHPASPARTSRRRSAVLAFSHGAFSSPDRYATMLAPLAGAGFVVIAPIHIDSETRQPASRPAHAETWRTRNDDMALALTAPPLIAARLQALGLRLDRRRPVAMGHSYGALIAQLQGGAIAIEPDGGRSDRRNPTLAAVVAWSPPGPFAGLMAADGWRTLSAPALTITGTADIVPGFADDWRAHRTSFDTAPAGRRTLWVGTGVDHYFGGLFGREKPADPAVRQLFDRALAQTLHFVERQRGGQACAVGTPIAGESRVDG